MDTRRHSTRIAARHHLRPWILRSSLSRDIRISQRQGSGRWRPGCNLETGSVFSYICSTLLILSLRGIDATTTIIQLANSHISLGHVITLAHVIPLLYFLFSPAVYCDLYSYIVWHKCMCDIAEAFALPPLHQQISPAIVRYPLASALRHMSHETEVTKFEEKTHTVMLLQTSGASSVSANI